MKRLFKFLFIFLVSSFFWACSSTYVEVPKHGKTNKEIPQTVTEYEKYTEPEKEPAQQAEVIYYYQPEIPPEPEIYQKEIVPILL